MKKEEKLQDEKSEHIVICPECGAKLPLYTEEGNHNLCPKSTEDYGIIKVCMKCKMREIIAL